MYSVDTNNGQLDVWLVKVPKYVAKSWKEAPERAELGKLQRGPDGSFKFVANQKATPSQNAATPSSTSTSSTQADQQLGEHKLTLQPITHQRMAIISQTKVTSNGSTNPAQPNTTQPDKTSFEGDINFRGELRPTGDNSYMNLKATLIRQAAQPVRVTQKLDKCVITNKPRSIAQLAREADLRKKKEEAKRYVREDKEIVKERVFKAFEKQQYYNIKDLERITCQPVPYLKDILKDICKYCSSGAHKNLWELKPEYRFYKT